MDILLYGVSDMRDEHNSRRHHWHDRSTLELDHLPLFENIRGHAFQQIIINRIVRFTLLTVSAEANRICIFLPCIRSHHHSRPHTYRATYGQVEKVDHQLHNSVVSWPA
jgi:hypothetical protein